MALNGISLMIKQYEDHRGRSCCSLVDVDDFHNMIHERPLCLVRVWSPYATLYV